MTDRVDFLLIGGGLASAQAARSISEAGAAGRVMIVAGEPELPYNRPPLSKGYLQGKETRESIFVKPRAFWDEQRVEIVTGRAATALDRAAHSVALDDGSVIGYGKLLLATGSEPRRLNLPGAGLNGIYYLRTVADSTAIREAAAGAKRAVILGGGFIGTEVAASLAMAGVDVTLLLGEDVLLRRQIGPAAGKYLMRYFEAKGVKFVVKAQTESFTGGSAGGIEAVRLRDGREIACDMAVVGVGVTPRTALAGAAGLEVDNGVVVDRHLRSSDPDIFAAGDVANFVDGRYGHRFRIEHWDHARASGKTAGLNMSGQDQPFDHLHYFYSDLFDLNLEAWRDMYETDEVIEQPARSRAGGHPAWHYLDRGRLQASAFINVAKEEKKAAQELLKARPEVTGELRRKLAGEWLCYQPGNSRQVRRM